MPSTQAIYLDAEEEIPDLIDRLRETGTEEVPVVVPSRSRVGQSRFNFQLLRDFARSLDKRVAVVSSDGGVREMAEAMGFPTFTDMDEFRWAVDREPIGAPAGRATAVAGGGAAVMSSPRPAPSRERPIAARKPGLAFSQLDRAIGAAGGTARGRFLLYLGAGMVLVIGLLSAAVLVPSAQVTLTAKATPITADAEVVAAPNSAPVKVRQVTASKNASRQFQATGQKVTPATAAAGSVTYTNKCGFDLTTHPGQIVSTASGIQFTQQADATIRTGKSADAAILANSPGAAGNVGAGSITQISNAGPFASCLTVSNSDPTNGGADEKKETFVSQGDLDSAKAALASDLKAAVSDALAAQAQTGEKLGDAIDFQEGYAADHKPNDFVPGFTATLSETGNGAVYQSDDVKKALIANLHKQIPANQALTDNPIQTDFHIVTGTADGHITFTGKASGYVAPQLDYDKIRSRLLGSSTASARLYLQTLPVESVAVKEKPLALPIMPVLGSRIDIKYVVEGAPTVSAA
jgi:hypothetical protein